MQQIIADISEPADHLALDEALLLRADAGSGADESIRVWEFDRHIVVLGRSSKIDLEVDRKYCKQHDIPIMRRCSGGAAIVGGPGCLMYSVILSHQQEPGLQKIDAAHRYMMERVVSAVRRQILDVEHQGICDLTYKNRKCSGNSLRISREHLLYHGTVLYDADLSVLSSCLSEAPRQPEYRSRRDHHDFVTNIPIDPDQLRNDLLDVFCVSRDADSVLPTKRMEELRQTRYDNPDWHLRH